MQAKFVSKNNDEKRQSCTQNLRNRLLQRYAADAETTVVLHTRFGIVVWSIQKSLKEVRIDDRLLYTAIVILGYRNDATTR